MALQPPQNITKEQASKLRDYVLTGDSQSATLDADNTSATVTLGCVGRQITLQASGDLVGTYAVSANGVNFTTPTALGSSNSMVTYNTNNVKVIKLARTSGSGTVTILASA
jgi:hypothetical protein